MAKLGDSFERKSSGQLRINLPDAQVAPPSTAESGLLAYERANGLEEIIRVTDFEKSPTAERSVVINGRYPERSGRHDLGGLLLLFFACHFDDQVQRIEHAAAVVDHGDEVRVILVLLTIDCIGNREAQVVVLQVP